MMRAFGTTEATTRSIYCPEGKTWNKMEPRASGRGVVRSQPLFAFAHGNDFPSSETHDKICVNPPLHQLCKYKTVLLFSFF